MPFDGNEFRGPGGVNVAEILRVADLVEKSPPEQFDMSNYCGTACCIAGYALRGDSVAEDLALRTSGWDRIVGDLFGLRASQRGDLFAPAGLAVGFDCFAEPGAPTHITNAHAAACLRNLAATGKVDWRGTKPTPKAEG